MSGYIKLHRGWTDNDIFRKSGPFCQRAAWAWLLEKTAWKDGHRRDPHGNIVEVCRGQIHTSTRTLGEAWGWSKNKVDRFLLALEKCQMVDRTTDHHGVMLTICNYEKYQGDRTIVGPQNGTGADQGRTTQEESKEGKKKEIINEPCCPDDVSADVWADFKAMRRKKNAPVNDTALRGLRRESEKAGWPLERALSECVTQGWQGFKAHWVERASNDYEMRSII